MSGDNEGTSCCASCGVAETDDIKLVPCDGCDLVKYCSDECRENHKSQHKKECKKRAAELRDELLFKQPESTHLGDCPICMIPLPYDITKTAVYNCCSKSICNGCVYANQMREIEMRLQQSCPFCREPVPRIDDEEHEKLRAKRVEANDPAAMCSMGLDQYDKGDYRSAFECFTKAAELGDAEAHFRQSILYRDGDGVEKNKRKEMHHLEEAAIGGHFAARHNLGVTEIQNGRRERAVKHWIIGAAQGEDESIKSLMRAFREGFVRKDDLASAIRAHRAAVDETKSPQREAAEKYYRQSINHE